MSTWDDFRKEIMPDLETNPEEYPEYFYATFAIDIGNQIRRAREDMDMSRKVLVRKLKMHFSDINEKYVFRLEMGLCTPNIEVVQMCALILEKDINVTIPSKA